MTSGPTTLRRRTALALGALVVTAAAAALPASASAAFDPICGGRVSLGARAESEVKYSFTCSDTVAGFAIASHNRDVESFETELTATNFISGEAAGDASCIGEIPSSGFACTAGAGAPILSPNRIGAAFNIAGDPCVGQRPRVSLFVVSPKGETAGPFTLINAKPGPATRPLEGCPTVVRRRAARRQSARRLHR